MSKMTESAIEDLAIERLRQMGYSYLHGSVIAFDGEVPERANYADVMLVGRLKASVDRINPRLSPDVRTTAIKEVLRIQSPELLANNESFHRLLTEGVPVSIHKDATNGVSESG
jgi:type I restriction enzyme, R subunit